MNKKVVNLMLILACPALLSITVNLLAGSYSTKGKNDRALKKTAWQLAPEYWVNCKAQLFQSDPYVRNIIMNYGDIDPYILYFRGGMFEKGTVSFLAPWIKGTNISGRYKFVSDDVIQVEWYLGRDGTERWRIHVDSYRNPQELAVQCEDGAIYKYEPEHK